MMRLTTVMNFVYALFVPLLIITLYNASTGASIHKHHVAILGIGIALLLASSLTDIVKNMVGRPRPDLLARCKPAPDTPLGTLVSHTVCTETDRHKLQDGWRSFPSGHSSFAFAGLGYLSLFLSGQLKIFVLRNSNTRTTVAEERLGGSERPIHVRGDLGRALVCLLPILGAAVIAITRCQDYRHDVYDVCVGSFLGWSIAYWSYRRYWPRLDVIYCDDPYTAPESSSPDSRSYRRLRDEELGSREVGFSPTFRENSR